MVAKVTNGLKLLSLNVDYLAYNLCNLLGADEKNIKSTRLNNYYRTCKIEKILSRGLDSLFDIPKNSAGNYLIFKDPYFYVQEHLNSSFKLTKEAEVAAAKAVVGYCLNKGLIKFNIVSTQQTNEVRVLTLTKDKRARKGIGVYVEEILKECKPYLIANLYQSPS